MKKLRLEIDDLAVESFAPVAPRGRAGAGSVHGRQSGEMGSCYESECGCEPLPSERPDCTDQESCYAPMCNTDTNFGDCSEYDLCSVQYCQSVGEC
jgi:hypothetical protein